MKGQYRCLSGQNNSRWGGVELIKVIAIMLIVVSHVVQSLSSVDPDVISQRYILNLTQATTNPQMLLLSSMRYCGMMGNMIFFVCSAWFLIDSDKVNKRKVLGMLGDIWTVSVLIGIFVYVSRGGIESGLMVFRQFFPTIFENNWYMTSYILLYMAHPSINVVINRMSQKALLRLVLVLLAINVGVNWILGGMLQRFFLSTTNLTVFVSIYFLVAYIKRYLPNWTNNRKSNIVFLFIGILGGCGLILFTNYLGLRIEFFKGALLNWISLTNPFILIIAICLFNLARNWNFSNSTVNNISKLSMLIYIIHENMLLAKYYRPLLWVYVFEKWGYDFVVLWSIVISMIVFVFGVVCSILYRCTFGRIVTKVCEVLYSSLSFVYHRFESVILKIS